MCATCAAQAAKTTVIPIAAQDTVGDCPACGQRYRLLTRELADVQVTVTGAHLARYDLRTLEGAGRFRTRHVDAQPGIGVQAGDRVTLVWQRGKLVGIADQTRSNWWAVTATGDAQAPARGVWRALLIVCGVLVALQAVRWASVAAGVVSASAGAVALTAVIVCAIAAAPAAWWSIRAAQATPELGHDDE